MTEEEARKIQRPWTGRNVARVHDPKFCCASVVPKGDNYGWLHQYQCTKKPTHWHGSLGYCGTHDPVAVNKRRDAANARYEAEVRARQAESKRRALKDACLDAVKQIAAGHNDPMTLCREVLAGGSSNGG